jgi:hypothetical protein
MVGLKDELTTFDIIKKLGIDHGRLREWMNEGFIVPSIRKAEGIGTKAIFDRIDIVAVVLFRRLLDAHKMARKEASVIVSLFSQTLHTFLETGGEELVDSFLHGDRTVAAPGWGRLWIGKKKNGEVIVTPFLAVDLARFFPDTNPVALERFREKLGGADVFEGFVDEEEAADRFIRGIKGSFDYVNALNLRDIVEEASKVYDEA